MLTLSSCLISALCCLVRCPSIPEMSSFESYKRLGFLDPSANVTFPCFQISFSPTRSFIRSARIYPFSCWLDALTVRATVYGRKCGTNTELSADRGKSKHCKCQISIDHLCWLSITHHWQCSLLRVDSIIVRRSWGHQKFCYCWPFWSWVHGSSKLICHRLSGI